MASSKKGGFQYIHRNDVHDNSMTSLHTPVSLVEYAIRREHFGEGMLAVTGEGSLTGGATQKYPHLQKQFLKDRKKLGSVRCFNVLVLLKFEFKFRFTCII